MEQDERKGSVMFTDGSKRMSNYFQVKRSQPFLVTFFMAVLAFKRVAKMLKNKLDKKASRTKTNRIFVKSMKPYINDANKKVLEIKRGQPLITLTAEEFKENELAKYLNPSTEADFLDAIEPTLVHHASRPTIIKRKKKTAALPYNLAEKLQRVLQVKSSLVGKSVTASEHVQQAIHSGLNQLIVKNAIISTESSAGFRTFVPGSALHYGSTIALQAFHGGYLSFNDDLEIKASAHKILPHTRFIICKADELTYSGTIRYGDAVMLQAGQHEILGAQFCGKVDPNEIRRPIKPALISFRDKDSQRAKSYGRWIICARDDAEEKLKNKLPVAHHDRILLEQEWYFLASTSPYNSSMEMHSNFEIAVDEKLRKYNAGLFSPKAECMWKVILVSFGGEVKNTDQTKEYDHEAGLNILKSEEVRWEMKRHLTNNAFRALPPYLQVEQAVKDSLQYKQSEKDNQTAMLELFYKVCRKEDSLTSLSIKSILKTYGPDSLVYKHALTIMKYRVVKSVDELQNLFSVEPVNAPSSQTRLEMAKESFWNHVDQMLIDTRTFADMTEQMAKYYDLEAFRVLRAGLLIYRYILRRKKKARKYFYYMAEMKKKDKLMIQRICRNDEEWRQKQEEHKKLVLERAKQIAIMSQNNKRASVMSPGRPSVLDVPGTCRQSINAGRQSINAGRASILINDDDGGGDGNIRFSMFSSAQISNSTGLQRPSRPASGSFLQRKSFFQHLNPQSPHKSDNHELQLQVQTLDDEIGPQLRFDPVKPSQMMLQRINSEIGSIDSSSDEGTPRKVSIDVNTKPSNSPIVVDTMEVRVSERPVSANLNRRPKPLHWSQRCNDVFAPPTPGKIRRNREGTKLMRDIRRAREWTEKRDETVLSLVRTLDRPYGLPSDVLENQVRPLSLSASLKFLKASNPDGHVFDGVKVKKRSSKK